MYTYTYEPTSYPYRQSSDHPSFQRSNVNGSKQVFISSRWAGARRFAPLLLVNGSSGPSAPGSKKKGKKKQARGNSLTEAIIKTEVMF